MSFLRHALRACPGDSSRQPWPWRAARAIGSCTTGWVSTMGARFGFAKNFGFRSTGSRPSRVADLALGDYETALVLSLVPDDTSVPNPTSDKPAPRHGPIG